MAALTEATAVKPRKLAVELQKDAKKPQKPRYSALCIAAAVMRGKRHFQRWNRIDRRKYRRRPPLCRRYSIRR